MFSALSLGLFLDSFSTVSIVGSSLLDFTFYMLYLAFFIWTIQKEGWNGLLIRKEDLRKRFIIPIFGIGLNPWQMKVKSSSIDLHQKIFDGVKKAVQKLIEETARQDGELVISQNGKVVKVKARELLKQVSDR